MDVETRREEGKWESGDVGFDLREVARLFRCCRRQDGSIALWQYLLAYNELNKFFLVLGRIFYFVHSEVSDKTRILAEHLSSECGVHYESVQSMLEYELRFGVVDQEAFSGRPSGARTLLRLHRALQFVSRFIDSVSSSDSDHLALLARTAYDETLAKHHTWLVRKGVHLAVYTLPSRKQLLYRICSTMGHSEIEESLRQLVVECEEVFQNVQTLYANQGLLDLA